MKNRYAMMILLGALVVTLVIIAIEKPSEAPFISDYDVDDVWHIEVSQLLDETTLKREGSGWIVAESPTPLKEELLKGEGREIPAIEWRPALESRISHALKILGNLDEGIVVSRRADKRALYRVDATGLHIKLAATDGRIIADVWIGKNGPDYGSSYIRRADEDEIYIVRRPLLGLFSPVATDWLPREDKQTDHLPR